MASGQTEYDMCISNVTGILSSYLNERFVTILKDPVLKAACIFEHARWPGASSPQLDSYGADAIKLLLKHYENFYLYLSGDATKALREWRRLKKFAVSTTETLVSLSYSELYERLFDQYSHKDQAIHYYHILLLAAIAPGCIAVDTSICERGFSLMNNLKTARR